MFAIVKGFLMITGTLTGVMLGYNLGPEIYGTDPDASFLGANPDIKLAIILGMLGYVIASMASRELQSYVERFFSKVSLQDVIAGGTGFLTGLIFAQLILIIPTIILLRAQTTALERYLAFLGPLLLVLEIAIPLLINLIFAYIGMTLVMRYRNELYRLIGGKIFESPGFYKVLDTSVLIDGRIIDIFKTGFLEGKIIIPKFVLNELQYIADSADALKRNRGRRGLEVINKLQQEASGYVEIRDEALPQFREVDEKLIALSKMLNAKIVTNDFNLNKVAKIQGVDVLNINDLANAIKPVVLPGEEMTVTIIKEGKEQGQGVGYLIDGTMVVVEDGGDVIGQTEDVVVTSMLQTSAGRLVFTRLKKNLEFKKHRGG